MVIYPYNTIQINGRAVKINLILSGDEKPASPFESNTFSFIKDWLSGANSFTIFTSGSTGRPKPISITRDQMKASAQMTIEALGLQEADVAFVCLDTSFIAGKMMLVRAFENSMQIVVVEPSSDPLKSIDENLKIDFAAFVPIQLFNIVASEESLRKINTLKKILVGGGHISRTLEASIKDKITAPLYHTYGMTETISHIALQKLNTQNQEPYFTTLPGIKIDKDERGCLIIETPYHEEKIITNDLVEIIDLNTFTWLGRWDNVINTGGIKIMPETLETEISNILQNLGINENFFIFGAADDSLGSKLILAFEGILTFTESEILHELKLKLPKYMTPREIKFLPHFSYTATGKINRSETIKLL